jgi:hypothetical protein
MDTLKSILMIFSALAGVWLFFFVASNGWYRGKDMVFHKEGTEMITLLKKEIELLYMLNDQLTQKMKDQQRGTELEKKGERVTMSHCPLMGFGKREPGLKSGEPWHNADMEGFESIIQEIVD